MRYKARASWVLALVGMTVAVACGNGSSGSGTASAPVTLSMWAMGDEGDKLPTSTVMQAFLKANPNIKVNVTAIPWSVAHDKLVTAVAGRQTPDLSLMGTTWMGEFAKIGVLDQIPSSVNKGDFYPGAWTAVVANGKAIGVPWYVDTRTVFYRTDLAQKAGITSAPQTWSDLLKLAQAYKTSGAQYGIYLQSNDDQEWLPFLYSAGGDVMQNGKFTLDSQASVKSLTEWVKYFQQGLTPKSEAQGFDVTQTFTSGATPMFISGPWQISTMQKNDPQIAGKWAVARVPKDLSSTSWAGGGDLAVFKSSQHRDAAWKLVQFMTQSQQQINWFKTINDLPAVKASWSDPALSGDQNLKVYGDQLTSTKAPPAIAEWTEIDTQINDWLEKASVGQVTPAAAAAGMQQAATSIHKS
ncbi:MAG: sugar ABC transporter substrate-binding protein [Candidatus Dormibacteraeota bacterium]|nr:sugar ABC transporter substrate-binding protein [Candidatus Dormibacteraeota bacterium]MDQ6900451.1 sugar ABC transporter substrate-binding protein [Candidatus Dormibacteraeota bacterium]